MHDNPAGAYLSVEQSTLSGRELEAAVLVRAAAMLYDVKQRWNEPEHNERLDHALRYNQRLWTLFQAELLDESNPLPVEVKRNLLTLSSFVDRRTFQAMAYPEPEKLDILIDINRNIAAGLRGEIEQAAGPGAAGGGA